MKKPVRKALFIFVAIILAPFLFFKSCVIHNPKPSECAIVTTKIIQVRGGSTFDIQFKGNTGKTYYINRGLERGLNLDTLNALVLNKTVTLHLAKLAFGPTKHIAQLAIEDQVIFTEFN